MTAPNPKLTDALLKAALVRRSAGARTSAELIGDVLVAVETVPRHSWGLRLAPRGRLLPVLIAAALLFAALIGFAVGAGSRLVVDDPDDILTQLEIVAPFIGLPPEVPRRAPRRPASSSSASTRKRSTMASMGSPCGCMRTDG